MGIASPLLRALARGGAALALGLTVVAASAPLAKAQDGGAIAVRATETDYGSRIEIPVADSPFAVTPITDRRLDVTLIGAGQSFDVSQLSLGRLSRHIASARSGAADEGAALTLILACDCAYTTRLAGGVLAIDILSNAPGADEAAKADRPAPEAPAESGRAEAAPLTAPAAAPAPTRKAETKPWPGTKHAPRRAPVPPVRGVALHTAAGAAAEPAETAAKTGGETAGETLAGAEADDVMLARQRLLEQLTRAADQGLLEFDGDHPKQPGGIVPSARTSEAKKAAAASSKETSEEAEPVEETAEAEPAREETPPAAAAPTELAVRARTATDYDFEPGRADTFAPPAECPETATLALPAPLADGAAFSARTAAERAEIVDDFGAPVPDAISRLARHYIAHGFGAEARYMLSLLDGEGAPTDPRARFKLRKERALLEDMARIVDGDPPASDGRLREVAACGGVAGLWAEAGGVVRGAWAVEPVYAEALANSYDDAPAWLRVALGPRLIESRVTLGDLDTAQRFADILARTPGADGPSRDLALARLLAARGDEPGARGLLNGLADLRSPETRLALLAMAETYDASAPPPPEFADRLSEAAWLAEGDPLAGRLKLAEVRMILLSDGAPAALDAVRMAMTRRGADRAVLTDAGHGVLETLATDSRRDPEAAASPPDRLALARAVSAYAPFISTARDGDRARASAADALTRLGLATLALDVLSSVDERRNPALAAAAERARAVVGDSAEDGEAAEDLVAAADVETDGEDRISDAGAATESAAPADGRRDEDTLTEVVADATPVDPAAAALAEAEEALAAARAARIRIEEALRDG